VWRLPLQLLWVTHPVHVVAVSYVVQRVESLMGLFVLATLYASVRALEGSRRRAWMWLALLTCGLGMGTKEVMVGVPLLAVLMESGLLLQVVARCLARTSRALFRSPRRPGSCSSCLSPLTLGNLSAGAHASSLTSFDYFRMQCVIVTSYLALIFHPLHLVFDYGDALTSIPVPTRISEWGPGLLVLTGLGVLALFRVVARAAGYRLSRSLVLRAAGAEQQLSFRS